MRKREPFIQVIQSGAPPQNRYIYMKKRRSVIGAEKRRAKDTDRVVENEKKRTVDFMLWSNLWQ